MTKPQRVLDGNRITLPFEFVQRHAIQVGAFVLVDETKDGLLIKAAKVVPQ